MKKLVSLLMSACILMSSASYAMPVIDFSVEESDDTAEYEAAAEEYSYLSGEDILLDAMTDMHVTSSSR